MTSSGTLRRTKVPPEGLPRAEHFPQELCGSVPSSLQRMQCIRDATRQFQEKGLEGDQGEAPEAAGIRPSHLPGYFSVPSPPSERRSGGTSSPHSALMRRLNSADAFYGGTRSGSNGTPPRPSRHQHSISSASGGLLDGAGGAISAMEMENGGEASSTHAESHHRRSVSALCPAQGEYGSRMEQQHSPTAARDGAVATPPRVSRPREVVPNSNNRYGLSSTSERFDKGAAASAMLPPLPKAQSLPNNDHPTPQLTPRGMLVAYHQYLSLLPEEDEEGGATTYPRQTSAKPSVAGPGRQWMRADLSIDTRSPLDVRPLKRGGAVSAPLERLGSLPPPHQRTFKLTGSPHSPGGGSSSPSPSSSPIPRPYSPHSKGPKRLPVAGALSPLSSSTSILDHMADPGYTKSEQSEGSPLSCSSPQRSFRQLPTCSVAPFSAQGAAGDVIGCHGYAGGGERHQITAIRPPASPKGKPPKRSSMSALSPLLFITSQSNGTGMDASGTPLSSEGSGTRWGELEGSAHSRIDLSPSLGSYPLRPSRMQLSPWLDSTEGHSPSMHGRLSPRPSIDRGTPSASPRTAAPAADNGMSIPVRRGLPQSSSVDGGFRRLSRLGSGSARLSSSPSLDTGTPPHGKASLVPQSPSTDYTGAHRTRLSPSQSAESVGSGQGGAALGHATVANGQAGDSNMPSSGRLSPSASVDSSSHASPSPAARRGRRSLGIIPRTTSDLVSVALATSVPDDVIAAPGSPAHPKPAVTRKAWSRLPRSSSDLSLLYENGKGPGETATGLTALKKWQEAQMATKQWPGSPAGKPSAPKAPKVPPLMSRPSRRPHWRIASHSDSFALQPGGPTPESLEKDHVAGAEWPEVDSSPPAGKAKARVNGVKLAVSKHKYKHKGSASQLPSLASALSVDCGAAEVGPTETAIALAGFHFEKGQDVSKLLQSSGPGPAAPPPPLNARELSAPYGESTIGHRVHHSADLSKYARSGPEPKGAQEPTQEGRRKIPNRKGSVDLATDGGKGRHVGRLRPKEHVLEREYEDIRPHYAMHKDELGSGQFGVIRKCIDISTGDLYACKTLNKKKIQSADDADDIRREVACLSILRGHPTVVGLRETFEDKENIHLIMDLCNGGDLFDRVKAKGQLAERDAARLCRSLVEALLHCHCLGITHRDIKPENILMVSEHSDAEIKLVDFGIANFFQPNQDLNQITGTLEYMAPEVIRGCYGPEADIWSAGVVLYITVSGIQPFWASSQAGLAACILGKEPSFASRRWEKVSEDCKDLVRRMLSKDRAERISATEILSHPWIHRYATR